MPIFLVYTFLQLCHLQLHKIAVLFVNCLVVSLVHFLLHCWPFKNYRFVEILYIFLTHFLYVIYIANICSKSILSKFMIFYDMKRFLILMYHIYQLFTFGLYYFLFCANNSILIQLCEIFSKL